MPYKEAVEDGVRSSSFGLGTTYYYPICTICHKNEVPTWSYIRGQKYVCKECKAVYVDIDKDRRVNNSFDDKEKKFSNAVLRVRKKARKFSEYKHAIEIIHEKLHTDKWFDSTEEIMVAIELVKNNVKARHQVKFGPYRVDFLLPDYKVILEVDGRLFHGGNKSKKEQLRDNCILLSLGPKWEMIRISDDIINKNITKLIPAIETIKTERSKVRNNNGGILPNWYTEKTV